MKTKVKASNSKPSVKGGSPNGEQLRQMFLSARQELCSSLIEREEEIDLVMTSLICQEHPLLVGPPGTGKSLLCDSLVRWMKGCVPFPYLLTKYTTPEELFGPISLTGLKQDKFVRVTSGKLPEAEIAFVDEIWKASSAILNTLLKILNERVYDNGEGVLKHCPLLLCLAASNEWPQDETGKELGALFDRFLFRKRVNPVSKQGLKQLLKRAVDNDDCKAAFTSFLTPEEVKKAHEWAMTLPVMDDTKKSLWQIILSLEGEGINPGNRRVKKSIAAIRSYAWLQGAQEVHPEHLEILSHVLWDDPQEQPEKCRRIVQRICNPQGSKIAELLGQAEEIMEKAQPTEAVPKLQAIRDDLLDITPTERNKEKLQDALETVKDGIKERYDSIIGVRKESK